MKRNRPRYRPRFRDKIVEELDWFHTPNCVGPKITISHNDVPELVGNILQLIKRDRTKRGMK